MSRVLETFGFRCKHCGADSDDAIVQTVTVSFDGEMAGTVNRSGGGLVFTSLDEPEEISARATRPTGYACVNCEASGPTLESMVEEGQPFDDLEPFASGDVVSVQHVRRVVDRVEVVDTARGPEVRVWLEGEGNWFRPSDLIEVAA
jgi:hypothetical protein